MELKHRGSASIWEADHWIDCGFSPLGSEGAVEGQKAGLVHAPVCTHTHTHTHLVPLEYNPRCLCWALNTALSSYLTLAASSLSDVDTGLKTALWPRSRIRPGSILAQKRKKKLLVLCLRATLSPRSLSPLSPLGLYCLMSGRIDHLTSTCIRERCGAGDWGTAETEVARWRIQTLLMTVCLSRKWK